MHHVGLFLDVAVVLGLGALVAKAFFVTVQHDVVLAWGDIVSKVDGLGDVVGDVDGGTIAFGEVAGQFEGRLLAHAVGDHVGARVDEDTGAQAVLPVVVVGDAPQGGLDASQNDGDVRVELFQNLGVDDGGVLRPQVVAPIRAVGILKAQPSCGGVLVDHRVHAARGDAEEQPRTSKFLEVAVVAVPVGLWDDGHAIACGFERTSDDRCPKRRMVHIGIG